MSEMVPAGKSLARAFERAVLSDEGGPDMPMRKSGSCCGEDW